MMFKILVVLSLDNQLYISIGFVIWKYIQLEDNSLCSYVCVYCKYSIGGIFFKFYFEGCLYS